MSRARFFSFRKPPDWKRGAMFQLVNTAERLRLAMDHIYQPMRQQAMAHPGIRRPVKDMTVDARGRWFLLAADGIVWRADLTSGHIEAVYELPAELADGEVRLAVSGDTLMFLLPGMEKPLQAYLPESSQLKWETGSWDGTGFQAAAIAADSADEVTVLALLDGSSTPHLLRFGASGQPIGQREVTVLGEFDDIASLAGRFELSLGYNGQVWLLDKEAGRLWLVQLTGETSEIVTEQPFLSFCPGEEPGCGWGLLAIGDASSSDCRIVRILRNGTIEEHGHAGHSRGRELVASRRGLYLWDAQELAWQPVQPVAQTAVWQPFGRRLGGWISDSLDSGSSETEWHKVVLHAAGMADTRINLRYYASDVKEKIIGHERVDLDRYILDSSIAPEVKWEALADVWSEPLQNPKDALIKAKGRYLWICMELIGSETHSPEVHSLEVHFPRESPVSLLPAIYQQDSSSREFLDRYLSLFQTMLEDTDHKIEQVTSTFDSHAASGPSLRWLLGWLGIEAEDNWTEEQLRQLLKYAPSIYNLRGTRYAMERLIAIYTGEKPIILEYEQVKPLKEHPELGGVAERLYAADPHVFNVLVKSEHAESETDRVTLQQLIDAAKPAFATGKLVVLQPWVHMDLHSYLGMNTVLSEPTLLKLDGRSSMPHHTIVIDEGQDNRVNQHTRLGLDSRLE
mgnify:CR=1 FL=1